MSIMTLAESWPLVRRLGTAAFVFFLVKGLLWIAAAFLFLWLA